MLPIAAVFTLASVTAGCSTFSDADAPARVNDAELGNDELGDLVDVLGQGDTTSGDVVRSTIQLWVLVEVVGAQLAADDTPLAPEVVDAATAELDAQLPGFAALSDSTRETLAHTQATLDTVNTLADPATFLDTATAAADIHIDPRFGTFDPEVGVIPLGGAAMPAAPGSTG